jgi:hypothetical protein
LLHQHDAAGALRETGQQIGPQRCHDERAAKHSVHACANSSQNLRNTDSFAFLRFDYKTGALATRRLALYSMRRTSRRSQATDRKGDLGPAPAQAFRRDAQIRIIDGFWRACAALALHEKEAHATMADPASPPMTRGIRECRHPQAPISGRREQHRRRRRRRRHGIPFVMSMLPSERAKAAGAPVEVDVEQIEMGQKIDVEWRGKVVWLVRRTPEMLASLPKLDSRVADPKSEQSQQPKNCTNEYRSIKPEMWWPSASARISDARRRIGRRSRRPISVPTGSAGSSVHAISRNSIWPARVQRRAGAAQPRRAAVQIVSDSLVLIGEEQKS